MLRLCVVAGDRSGPFYHQYAVPMKYLNDLKLLEMHATNYVTVDLLASMDVIEFQRQYASECVIIQRKLKEMGKTTIFHVDDNVWEIPPGNPAKSTYAPDSAVMYRYETLMRNCDWATTSTPYLAELIKKHGQPNVTIMRNLVEMDFIESFINPGRDNPDQVRLGWTGTPHHHDDIQIVEPAFSELLFRFPQLKLVFMGYAPVDKGVLHKYLGRWEYYEFVQVDAFYPALANMDFDIGIAPLTSHPFNKAKTARKAQEYAALKVPMILSPMDSYKEWVHGETCLKPKNNSVQDWVQDIAWMITHKADREKMAQRAYDQVKRNHDVKKWIYERAEQYEEIHKTVQARRGK